MAAKKGNNYAEKKGYSFQLVVRIENPDYKHMIMLLSPEERGAALIQQGRDKCLQLGDS